MAYDFLIKSGVVVDGTGNPQKAADIGIDGEKISFVGDSGSAGGKVTINALGKIIVPGFIDLTNHSDTYLTLFKHPGLESMAMQGVTTIIGGNCGASLAPLGSPQALDTIKKWADPAEINLNWAGMDGYLKTIGNLNPELNYGTFTGYGTLRRGVIGDRVRQLSVEEKEQVKYLLQQSLIQGSFGLSLGLAYGHERISTTEEIIDIAKVLEPYGGSIKVHLRSEGMDFLSSVNEIIRIAREVKVPIQISHMKAIGRQAWPSLQKGIELIAKTRESGLDINYDVSPYSTTGSLLYLLLPGWTRQGGFSELFRRIDAPAERKKIVDDLRSHPLHYEKILVTSAKLPGVAGHTLRELAEKTGLEPEELLLSTIRANEGRVSIIGRTVLAENTRRELSDPNSFVSSDGVGTSQSEYSSGNLIHPRSFGAFPRFLGKFVPKLHMELPKAVQKITSGPAAKLGIKDRGILKAKNFADVVIFDPKILSDRATYKDPYHYPSGIEWVFVNGKAAVEQGRYAGARAGKILRRS